MYAVASHVQQSVGAPVNAALIAQLDGKPSGDAGLTGILVGAAILAAVFLALVRLAWKSGIDRAMRGADMASSASAYSAWWFGK